MQEIKSIGAGVGRLFGRGGGDGGGERRLKPHQYHQGFAAGGHGCQALKCPRCDSMNTKFCYYNNYNLSQPRYFCKGCRRYWTKGGVLRNVPVGGGCRKNKRSKQKSGGDGDPSSSSVDVAPTDQRKSVGVLQNSSIDSHGLTANSSPEKPKATTPTPTPTPTPLTLTESAPPPAKLLNFQESSTKFYTESQSSSRNQSFPPAIDKCATDTHRRRHHHHHMFSETDAFKSLLTSSSDQLPLGFNFNPAPEVSSLEREDSKWQQWMDETYSRTGNGGATAEEWEAGGGGGDDGLFDQSYWSQIPWGNHELNYFH